MSYSQNFTVSQTPLNPSYVILTDTSTGTTPSQIAYRKIYVRDYDGNFIVPAGTTTNYIYWALSNNPFTINLLSMDMALNIQVDWVDINGNVYNNYTLNNNYCFSEYSKQFLYYLIQLQSQTYNIIQDNNYWSNISILWANIIGAINSVQIGNDIFASQVCLNRVSDMKKNQEYYF